MAGHKSGKATVTTAGIGSLRKSSLGYQWLILRGKLFATASFCARAAPVIAGAYRPLHAEERGGGKGEKKAARAWKNYYFRGGRWGRTSLGSPEFLLPRRSRWSVVRRVVGKIIRATITEFLNCEFRSRCSVLISFSLFSFFSRTVK